MNNESCYPSNDVTFSEESAITYDGSKVIVEKEKEDNEIHCNGYIEMQCNEEILDKNDTTDITTMQYNDIKSGGMRTTNQEQSVSTTTTFQNDFVNEHIVSDIKESNDFVKGMKMMTLGSNNNVFMTSKAIHGQPIYLAKELPKFLQDSLNESLSRTHIVEDEVDKVVTFIDYTCEEQLPDLTRLITKDLSEPYSIYTYRYFLHNWPQLSFLAYCDAECVGAIVCKLDQHRKNVWRGYIAMLVVEKIYRRHKIGTKLVQKAIRRMIEQGCDEVVLETEVTNKAALNLYENLGFVRDKRLLRYYLNGVDAWRLKLWLA